jgi:hypothetical protein
MRLAHQDQERRLEGILGIMLFSQQPPAHSPNHGAQTADQPFQCRGILPQDVFVQQFAIAQRIPVTLPEQLLNFLHNKLFGAHRHPFNPLQRIDQ